METVLHSYLNTYVRMCRASKQIPLSQLHWHSGAKEDTPWVLSDDHDAVDSTSQQSVVILKSAGADEL